VIGVVGDFKVRTPDELPTPMFFRPLAQNQGAGRLYLVARTAADPKETVAMMRRELRVLDADVPVYQAGTMRDHVSRALAVPRAVASMLAVFGGLALLLASLGLYAVVTFVVSRRSAEMGIRIALGASGGRVFGMIVKEMMAVVGIGVALGLGLSWLATPVLESLLFNIAPTDPLTFALVAALLALVALAAIWLPARRAARADLRLVGDSA
jgi:ABC-type antimicrobial peptide transport system permease subunit